MATPDGTAVLPVVICGAVGAGKTTLIERLVHDSQAPRPQLAMTEAAGDEHGTRELLNVAATARCAVLVVDAHKGVVTQTRRHEQLLALLGIREVIVVVNKMDIVQYAEPRFREIERELERVTTEVEREPIPCIPISALHGDNVLRASATTEWYGGLPLADRFAAVDVGAGEARVRAKPFRMPVRSVSRVRPEVRGYAGTVASGVVRRGDTVVVAPTGLQTTVAGILTADDVLEEATPGESIVLTLADDLDVTGGDVIASFDQPPGVATQFEATIVWTGVRPMLRGRDYLMKIGTRTVSATVAPLKYKININTLEHVAATQLKRDEIGVCGIELAHRVAFDSYSENRQTGGFILVDRISDETVGAGFIQFALRRSQNLRWQSLTIDKQARAATNRQRPTIVWLTGLSGAGKSTIANLIEIELHDRGHHTYLLDGDNVRHGLNADLGFTEADRVENIRRVAEVVHLMLDAGLVVIAAFISPFRAERRMARGLCEPGEFIEVFVDAPLAVVEQRDPKGLYKKARRGELQNFTGIDSPYERPEHPEIHVDTTAVSAEHAAQTVIEKLEHLGRLQTPDHHAGHPDAR